MRDFRKRSLLSFVSLSDLSGIKETHNSTTCAKWGVESLRAPPGRIFHRSPVLTAGWVKSRYHCAWLVYQLRVILLCSFISWDVDKLISWRWSSCLLFNFYVSLLPCRISHEQLYAALLQAVEPWATTGRGL